MIHTHAHMITTIPATQASKLSLQTTYPVDVCM